MQRSARGHDLDKLLVDAGLVLEQEAADFVELGEGLRISWEERELKSLRDSRRVVARSEERLGRDVVR
jgi:hypothetical protein